MGEPRAFARKLRSLIFPDDKPRAGGGNPTSLSRLATPHIFSPTLSTREALVAVAGCLLRIFCGCVLFAVWGGVSAYAWSRSENYFWRGLVALVALLLLLAGMSCLMIAVSLLERKLTRQGLKH